jgi:AraC-like DNA-binding protein
MSKSERPFQKLFRFTTPKDFITLFNTELPQTKAFILSFSPSKRYVRRVLHLLDQQEIREDDLYKRSSTLIRDYLQRCFEDTFELTFVKALEDEVNVMIAGYEDLSDLRSIRKRLFFRQPRQVPVER